MLSKPKFGWTTIHIKDFSGPASYLTDVPTNCLEECINAIKNKRDIVLDFDAEGYDIKIIVDDYRTYIIRTSDMSFYCYEMDKYEISNEIYCDISKYFDDWCKWDTDYGYDKNKDVEYKNKLNELLNELYNILEGK